jgi:hypothetical protein
MKERNEIHASYTINVQPLKQSSSRNKMKPPLKAPKGDAEKQHQKEKSVKDHCMGYGSEDDNSSEKKSKWRLPRKKWLNVPVKIDRRKPS